MKYDELNTELLRRVLGTEWMDSTVEDQLRALPRFNNWEYLNRQHFFALKVREIKEFYPEYIESKPKKIIDVSAGNGILLEIMRLLGHKITGTDNPGCSFTILARSQNVPIIEHDCNKMPLPFDTNSFDLLTNVGAIHHYKAPWEEVLDEFFRIAKKTIYISVSKGAIYDAKRPILDNYSKKRWTKIDGLPDGMYKWVKN